MNITLPFVTPGPRPGAGRPASLADRLNHMSEDEFYDFCQRNAESKFERCADGTIEFLTMTGGTTGRRNSELLTDLTIWNRQGPHGLSYSTPPPGSGCPTARCARPMRPGCAPRRWQALPAGQQEKFPPLCPDFVVELLSPSDTMTDLVAKMLEYIANGCRLALAHRPQNRNRPPVSAPTAR